MTVNLLQLIQAEIGSANTQEIGSLVGESETGTRSALSKAIAALLAGLVAKTVTGGGARSLWNELSTFDDSPLDDIGDFLAGDRQELARQGSKMLGDAFGENTNSVVDAIARASGIGSGASKSMLGALAPLVFGFLSRYVRTHGLDAAGLGSLLGDQRGQLRGALPDGLNRSFGLEEVRDGVSRAAAPAPSLFRRALPALLILAALWFGYRLLSDRDMELPDVSAKPPVAAMATLDQALNDVTAALTNVRDVDSAQRASESIRTAARTLGSISGELPQLSDASQAALSAQTERLSRALKTASEVPGAGAVLRPAMQELQQQLTRLMGA